MGGAIIFDLDGTLIDSRADLATAVNLTRREFGLEPLPVEQVAMLVGEGLRNLISRAWPEAGERLDAAVAVARQQYGEHLLDQTTLYPGVAAALRELRAAGYRLGVVTNKPQEFTDTILRGFSLDDCFTMVVGGGSGLPLKPDPAPVLAVLERCGVTPSRDSWMVGDHFTDLEVGRRVGLSRCFCRFGFGDPRGEGYELAVDSLPEFVERLNLKAQHTGG